MFETIIVSVVVGAVGVLGGFLFGLRLGKQAKLEELHVLQDEGFLQITYLGGPDQNQNPTEPRGKRLPPSLARGVRAHAADPRIKDLLYEEPPEPSKEPENWAMKIKAQQMEEE